MLLWRSNIAPDIPKVSKNIHKSIIEQFWKPRIFDFSHPKNQEKSMTLLLHTPLKNQSWSRSLNTTGVFISMILNSLIFVLAKKYWKSKKLVHLKIMQWFGTITAKIIILTVLYLEGSWWGGGEWEDRATFCAFLTKQNTRSIFKMT